jgi:hypothetical protein
MSLTIRTTALPATPLLDRPLPAKQFEQLEHISKPNITTAHAAYLLSRQQQTLRGWACHEDGPLRPLRINGRLAWPVLELKRILLGGVS